MMEHSQRIMCKQLLNMLPKTPKQICYTVKIVSQFWAYQLPQKSKTTTLLKPHGTRLSDIVGPPV